MLIPTLILLLILVDFKTPMLTLVSAMMLILVPVLLFVLPILLQIGIVMLTLTGTLASIQVWMFLIRKLYGYTANKIQLQLSMQY